jgi:PAS domain S-box-containing protein
MPPPAIPLDAIGDPAFVYNRDGIVVAANSAAERFVGGGAVDLSADGLADRVALRLVDGRSAGSYQDAVRQALEGRDAPALRGEIPLADGPGAVWIVTAPIREDGAITGALSIWHGAGRRDGMPGELSESEAKYRNLVELSPDAILIHQHGLIVFANPAAAVLVGAGRPEDLVGRPVLAIVHPGGRGYVEWNIEADLRGEESPITTVEVLREDGTTVTAQGRGAMIPHGGLPAVQVVLRDVTAEKRAEEALRESEERLRLAKACAGIGILEYHPATPGTTGPGDYLRVYHDAFPDVQQLDDWRKTVHPDDLERVEAELEAAIALGEPIEIEFRYDLGEGRTGWLKILGDGVFDEQGRLLRVMAVQIDITDQKEAEAALQESEQRHAFLLGLGDLLRELSDVDEIVAAAAERVGRHLGTSRVVYCEADASGTCATVRADWTDGTVPRAAGSFGLDDVGVGDLYRQGLVRRTGDVTVGGGEGAIAAHAALRIRASLGVPICRGGRLVAILEAHCTHPRCWTDTEAELLRDAGNRIWAAIGRARAEEALRKRERTLQGIFRAAPVGIGMVSHRTIIQANDQLCRMTGYGRDELIGQNARILYPDDETYEYVGREKYAQIMAGGTGAVETQWRRRDGSIRDVLVSSSPVDLSRPHEDVVFNALDITRLRESERALESYMDDLQRSNEELQRFAYVASHDLQEPLRSIISFSQLLERRYKGKLDADADDYIGFIVEGGNRMQALIRDLLQLSRVETKANPLAPTDAGEVAADALRLMETPIREAGATVAVGELPTVMADAAQLAQVFTNLVGNAIKYRREGVPPEVRISAERAGRFWRFAVEDNGIGIEAEYFDRIFVIFQRLHTRDEYEGTGIGLAVVRKIVERHGGRIRVESTLGEGSTFFFTLPAV